MTEPVREPVSRVARTSAAIAAASFVTAATGILGVQAGILSPMTAFMFFVLGAVLGALVSFILGAVGLFLTNAGRDPAGARLSWMGAGAGIGMLFVVVMSMSGGRNVPAINDITTNVVDPPAFVAAERDAANGGRDMSYPAEFAPIVREAYPDLAPIRTGESQDATYRVALDAARRLGWTIVYEDEAAGVFEAQEESEVFHFVDDIAVRVAWDGEQTVVDVRSKSRDGRGDMGVNAARIRAFETFFVPGNVAAQ